jgi:hypothetical protein
MTKSATIPIFLALLLASPGGLAQQQGDESNGIQDSFHPKQLADRVKRSKSLGGMTKLSLKKDYDRLLKMTRAYHEGDEDISLEQLRDRYDVMYHRLKTLLQDKDEEFTRFIHESKDIFWLSLSDEEQFAKMMGISVIGTQPEHPPSDIDPASDLRTVIILAGYLCNSVVEYSQEIDSAYHVSCDADRHYRVHVSEEEDVIVRRRSDPVASVSQDDMSHDELMKKHLLSVVNLAGHDCAGLSSYERYGSDGHLVTCENQTVYRIQVTPDGRVAVGEHAIKK